MRYAGVLGLSLCKINTYTAMKTFKLLLVFFLLSICVANAMNPAENARDSAKYKWVKGEKFLLHKVAPKETWNSISRKYDMAISELMKANLGLIDLKIGQIIRIPATKVVEEKSVKTETVGTLQENVKYKTSNIYTVRASETLFGISKKFNCTVDDLKKWNDLESNTVREGQKLLVNSNSSTSVKQEAPLAVKKNEPEFLTEKFKNAPSIKSDTEKNNSSVEIKASDPAGVRKDVPETTASQDKNTVEANTSEIKKVDTQKSTDELSENPTRTMLPVGRASAGKTLMQVSESGICSWISDSDINQNKYYGLHRTAPIGTIIKVTNKMNSKYVFVKVVGVLPDTGDNEKSILKISQASVNKLGALDAHFQVDLSYGMLQ